MGFFGFLTNIKSNIGLYNDYVVSGPLNEFYTFQYSQDHLETYFSLIRQSLGWNNNPNQIQFTSAYKKLLVCMPYASARDTNCILGSTNLLTVSSKQQPILQTLQQPARESFMVEIDDLAVYDLLKCEKDPYEEHLQSFIATKIEKSIINNIMKLKSACQCCLRVFSENFKAEDTFIARTNQTKPLQQPCKSTVDIIAVSDAVIKTVQDDHVEFNSMASTIFSHMNIEELYESSEFDIHQNPVVPRNFLTHKEEFVYDVLSAYMHIKSKKIGKRITIEEQKNRAIRRKLTRSIILAGQ